MTGLNFHRAEKLHPLEIYISHREQSEKTNKKEVSLVVLSKWPDNVAVDMTQYGYTKDPLLLASV